MRTRFAVAVVVWVKVRVGVPAPAKLAELEVVESTATWPLACDRQHKEQDDQCTESGAHLLAHRAWEVARTGGASLPSPGIAENTLSLRRCLQQFAADSF